MSALETVLERAHNARKNGAGYLVSCPCPGHGKGRGDQSPSVGVDEGEDGQALVNCLAGCRTEDVLAGWGLTMADLFKQRNGKERGGASYPSAEGETVRRCTVEQYSKYTKLPVGFLQDLGLTDFTYQNAPAIRIPYLGEDGTEISARFRIRIAKTAHGDDRFRWRKGDKVALYGIWRLEHARGKGYAVLVEGESDTQTLWFHGEPGFGIPGARAWKEAWAELFEGIERIYAVIESDGAGEALWEKLSACPLRERLYRVGLEYAKDVSELHREDPQRFEERFGKALLGAKAWMDIAETEAQERSREAWQLCGELAQQEDILAEFEEDLRAFSVAGESRLIKIVFLVMVSRLLEKIVSLVIKGQSSAGKSYTLKKVLAFFPEATIYLLTSMSEKTLAYTQEPLKHRMMVIFEAAGLGSDFAAYLMRSLLSEGKLIYEFVDWNRGEPEVRRIEKEGPTGLISTTTSVKLYHENETRLLSITADDSEEHTQRILETLADEEDDGEVADPPDLSRWHALQVYLKGGERRVWIPFSKRLARMVPPVVVRLRRDFPAVLALIRAHALLHRATRDRDRQGRIVATLTDYEVVYELVNPLFSEMAEIRVPETVREVVGTVEKLTEGEEDAGVSVSRIVRELKRGIPEGKEGPSRATIHRRVQRAIERGFLKNLSSGNRGQAYRLVVGEPMPEEDRGLLPPPRKLGEALDRECLTVSRASEGYSLPPPEDDPGVDF
jgi:hypothetical protein